MMDEIIVQNSPMHLFGLMCYSLSIIGVGFTMMLKLLGNRFDEDDSQPFKLVIFRFLLFFLLILFLGRMMI